jgi:hypothetical protein
VSVRVAALAALSLVAGTMVALVVGTQPAGAVTPVVSTSHYIRNLTGAASDGPIMQALGCNDADAGSTGVVLHLGAQSKTAPLSNLHPGVRLTNSDVRLTYLSLVPRLKNYLNGFNGCAASGQVAFIAVTTNNDGNYSNYPAASRGVDWWNGLIGPLRSYTSSAHQTHVSVVAGIDIEAGFASTFTQAQQWETSYLSKSVGSLVNTGSADGCPRVGTKQNCAAVRDDTGHVKTWTQANYYALSHNGSRIKVLPQIYVTGQASQWSHIDATGGKGLSFLGSLTEHAACPTASTPGCTIASFTPQQGWAQLASALAAYGLTPGNVATDLDIQS